MADEGPPERVPDVWEQGLLPQWAEAGAPEAILGHCSWDRGEEWQCGAAKRVHQSLTRFVWGMKNSCGGQAARGPVASRSRLTPAPESPCCIFRNFAIY